MKLTSKKKDALSCLLWAVLTIANSITMLATEENVYGFLMIFSLIWFLNEDRKYKQEYPEKKENNQ